jgi:hypothetical protein
VPHGSKGTVSTVRSGGSHFRLCRGRERGRLDSALVFGGGRWHLRSCGRQKNGARGSLSYLAGDGNRAAMRFDNFLTQG